MKLALPKMPLHGVRDACPHSGHLSGSVIDLSPLHPALRGGRAMSSMEGARATVTKGNFIFTGERKAPVV